MRHQECYLDVGEAGIVQTNVVQAPFHRPVEALLAHRVRRAQGGRDADHFLCGLAFITALLASVGRGSVAGACMRSGVKIRPHSAETPHFTPH